MKLKSFLTALALASSLPLAHADYSRHPLAQEFIADMAQRHGFSPVMLERSLADAQRNADVLRLIKPPATRSTRSWQSYRKRFLGEQRINEGVRFWRQHQRTIDAAVARYGVPAEVIVAIIGVETHYGSYTGNFEVLSALATLAFDYPPRADLFRRELESLFLLAREQQRSPASYYGSYAGAMGFPQFLPSSLRNYGVDFDGNGRIDFDSDPIDAIGSVANYLAAHGWVSNAPVAIRVQAKQGGGLQALVDAGIEPSLDLGTITRAGLRGVNSPLHDAPATLVDLPTPRQATEYWLGYQNFYVITRYNRSSFYAMSVFQLAEALRNRYVVARYGH